MTSHLFSTDIFWINYFPLSKPGAGLSNTKIPVQLVLGTVVDYKKVFRLHPGGYVYLYQEDESCNTIDLDQTFGSIFLVPQYNLRGVYF